MRNKKGFTLVELVIVIAVIAILAGVMIAVFANVVKDAQESAKLQELKSQEIAQKADDIIKKVDDANWLGWEDFETNLVARMTEAYKTEALDDTKLTLALQDAVKGAVNKYFAENLNENTGLTEAQVKAIVENALKGGYSGVTEAQVRAIVNSAVSGTSTLTRAQVQTIVDSASSKNLTAAQVSALVTDAVNGVATSATVTSQAEAILEKIESATANLSKLTEKQVEDIITAAVFNAGGVTKTWFDDTTYDTTDTFTLGTSTDSNVAIEQEVAGIATLVNGGYDFAGKTIVLPANTVIDLSSVGDWTPIGNSRGNEFKGEITSSVVDAYVTIKGLTLSEEFNAINKGYLLNCSSTGYNDKTGVGFVAYLGKGATLSYVKFVNVNINIETTNNNGVYFDGVSVGVAVGMLDGGTIDHVEVVSGMVKSVYRTAGLVGAATCGTIKDCIIGSTGSPITIESTGKGAMVFEKNLNEYKPATEISGLYCSAGGLIGYARAFDGNATDKTITITNVEIYANIKTNVVTSANGKAEAKTICAQHTDVSWNITDITFNGNLNGTNYTTAMTGTTMDMKDQNHEHTVES